jgi:hypothetical protein
MSTDVARYLDKPAAIVGTTGAGKTYVAKGAVERLLELQRRVIIIDPTGAWWGLRAGSALHPQDGFPVIIFGGEHADVAISPDAEAGKALALALAERHVQAIIDISEMTGGEKNRFLTPFLEHLYARNKAALHLVVDEADEIAAQRLADGEQRLFGAFDKIVRRGRIKGFRPLMISQRPAVIHKNVLSQIGTLIAMKLTSPQDRKAIEDWVKGNADAEQARAVMSSLPTLARGEGWVWSPADDVLERVAFPPIRTFDSSRTPGSDEKVVAPALTAVDVDALREVLAAAPSLPQKSSGGYSAADIEAAEKRGFDAGVEHGRSSGAALALAKVRSAIDGLRIPDLVGSEAAQAMTISVAPPAQLSSRDLLPEPKAKPVRSRSTAAPAGTATSGQAKLLLAIDTDPAVSWAAAALRAGYAESGGGFRKAKKEVIDAGLATDDGGTAVITHYTGAGTIPGREALVALWREKLWSGSAGLLGVLNEAGGHLPIDVLAARAGYAPTGGGFRKAMKLLRSSGLVVSAGPNSISFSSAFLEAAGG